MARTRRVTKDGPTPEPARRHTRSSLGILVAVLGFAIVFPLVAHLSRMDAAVVTATLAALPGILIAALNRN